MGLIKVYNETPVTPQSHLLDQLDAIEAFDLFVAGKTVSEVFHILCLDINKLKTLYTRLTEVIDMMERIVKREAWLVREESHIEVNEETGEQTKVIDVEGVICPVPTTIAKLKERCLELVQNDYDVSEPLFATDNVMDLVDGLNYVIEQVIVNSNITKDATYSWWAEQVKAG